VKSIDQSISDANDTISPYMKIVTIVLIVFFSVFILLGILGIIGTVLLTFFKKYRCRYLIYAICGVLCFLGLITFIIAVLLSVVTPVIFLGCEYIQTTLSSPSNFQSNLESVAGSDLTSYMSVCLPGESGRITDGMSTLNGSGLDELLNGMDTVANFNTSIVKESVA
jgi:predicted PurR-regulated permease PerM